MPLPQELYNEILAWVSIDEPTVLLTTSLVCRSWLPLSRQRFYSLPDMFIHIWSGVHWACLDLLTSPHCTILPHIRNMQFEFSSIYPNILSELPILPNVSTLLLAYRDVDDATASPFINREHVSFSSFPNVKRLELYKARFPSASEAFNFAGLFPRLTSLKLYACILNFKEEPLRTVRSLPPASLDTVIDRGSRWNTWDENGLASYLQRDQYGANLTIRHFELVQFDHRLRELALLPVLRHHATRIESLHIGMYLGTLREDLTFLKSLKALTLEVAYDVLFRQSVAFENIFTDQLETLTLIIAHFGIECRMMDEYPTRIGWKELCQGITGGRFPLLKKIRVQLWLGWVESGDTLLLATAKEELELYLAGYELVIESKDD